MPSIVVINDEGSVLYQNVVEDVQDLVKILRDGRNVPGYSLDDCPEVRVNGLIVLAGQPSKPKSTGIIRAADQRFTTTCKGIYARTNCAKTRVNRSDHSITYKCFEKKFGTDSRDQMMAMAGQLGLCDPFETSQVYDQQEDQARSR